MAVTFEPPGRRVPAEVDEDELAIRFRLLMVTYKPTSSVCKPQTFIDRSTSSYSSNN
jgi:hypothetical protein